jgi:trimeric autotransporter adhesin
VKIYNNTMHGTSSYTWYYYQGGTSTGDGTTVMNNNVTNSGGGNAIYLYGNLNASDKWSFNNLYTTGATLITNGSGTSYTNLPALQTAGYCYGCLSADAGHTAVATNLTPNASNANSWTLNGRGYPVSTISTDVNGNPRSTAVSTGAVDIGAYEFTPSVIPPAAVVTPAIPPVTGGYQVVTYGLDTIARINWVGGSVPSSVTVRQYTGTNPQNIILANSYYMNTYWDITVSPAASYNYSLELYHKGLWVGNNPNVADIIGAQYNGSWQYIFTTASNVAQKKLLLSSLTNFGQFTGTDANTPFTPAFMVLSDKTKSVTSEPLTVYPNPFNSELNVNLNLTTDGNIRMNLIDITGKTLISKEQKMNAGNNVTSLEGMANLTPGVYFLNIEMNGQSFVQKVVKQ